MDEQVVPNREICIERIKAFVEATESNALVAQEFLQKSAWNLNHAIVWFFDAVAKNAADDGVTNPSREAEDAWKNSPCEKIRTLSTSLRLMSWNICMLPGYLQLRMKAVLKTVQKIQPDVIFLQEVTNETADYFEQELPDYYAIRGRSEWYFVVTFLRIFTIQYDSHEVIPYETSKCGRNLLKVLAHVGDRKFAFFNTHLESRPQNSEERKKQLLTAFTTARAVPTDITAIFGGDLNLRDAELSVLPGISPFFDAWEACGSSKEKQFTWDTQWNTNMGVGDPEKRQGPRCRFDRLYIRPEVNHVRIKDFSLIGTKLAPKSEVFPSDHWGILLLFDLIH